MHVASATYKGSYIHDYLSPGRLSMSAAVPLCVKTFLADILAKVWISPLDLELTLFAFFFL